MPSTWLTLPTGETPLLALSESHLIAGCDTVLRSFAIHPDTGSLTALHELPTPSPLVSFSSVAVSPDGATAAALLTTRASHARDAPALLVLCASTLRMRARVELPHLHAADRGVPLALVALAPRRLAAVLPSVVLELDPVGLHVLRRVALEVPAGVPPEIPASPVPSQALQLACSEFEPVRAVAVHAVGGLEGDAVGGIVVRYASGEVAVYDVEAVGACVGTGGLESRGGAGVSPVVSYTGEGLDVLAVVGLCREGASVCAVALVEDRGNDQVHLGVSSLLSEEVVESTLPNEPCPQWAVIRGVGDDSCSLVEPVEGLREYLTADDLPLSCVSLGASMVAVRSSKDRVLFLDVNTSPSFVGSCCLVGIDELDERGQPPCVAASSGLDARWSCACLFPGPPNKLHGESRYCLEMWEAAVPEEVSSPSDEQLLACLEEHEDEFVSPTPFPVFSGS